MADGLFALGNYKSALKLYLHVDQMILDIEIKKSQDEFL